MTEEEKERLTRLHDRFKAAIEARMSETSSGGKSREGEVSFAYVMRDIYDSVEPPYWCVHLTSDLLIPERFAEF